MLRVKRTSIGARLWLILLLKRLVILRFIDSTAAGIFGTLSNCWRRGFRREGSRRPRLSRESFTAGVDEMNGSHEGSKQSDQGPARPASAGNEMSQPGTKRVDRRRLILTGMAAGPVLMTLGTSVARAKRWNENNDTTAQTNSSGTASGHTSIVTRQG